MHGIRSSAHTVVCIPLYPLERIPVLLELEDRLTSRVSLEFLRVEKNIMPPSGVQNLNCSACNLVAVLTVLFQFLYLV